MNRQRGGLAAIGTAVILMTLAAIVLAIVAARIKAARKTKPSEEQPLAVSVVTVAGERVENRLYLPARIEAEYSADIAVPKAGIVREILAERGDRVQKGQPILQQDDTTWNALFQRADIELREADRELRRIKELMKTGAVSESAMDGAVMRFDLARVGYAEMSNNLAKCRLESPASGIVIDRFLSVGEFAGEGAPAMRIVGSDTVKLMFDVPEREIRWVARGREAEFTVESVPDRVFTGTVAFLAAAAAPANNSFPAEMRAVNPENILLPGMIARVSILRRIDENAIRLPLKAVIPRKGTYIAFVVENGKAVRRIVNVEEIRGEDALISAGVKAGDKVVVEGNRSLSDGMRVAVTGQAASPNGAPGHTPTDASISRD